MVFVLSKIAGFFTNPSNVIFACLFVGVFLMATRYVKAGRALTVFGVLLLIVAGFGPTGNLLIYPLEQRFPAYKDDGVAPAGIVVLGGAINPEGSAARGTPMLNEAGERLTAVADLARRYPQARIVYSGGSANLIADGPGEAEFARPLFESFGISASRIEIENRSRSTYENAIFSRDLIRPKPGERWLLVTSAHHMPRSIGVFRAAGFPVDPYPVDWRVGDRADLLIPYGSISDGLKRTDTAMHEWIGLAGYFIGGKTAELFPAPR